MNCIGVKIKSFMHDKAGSTIIVVLVTMTFVVVLASILLYMSLVNMQMKKLDREGKANYYDAETAMNEIHTGIQGAVSEAISRAYTQVLINYNSTTPAQRESTFSDEFYNTLYYYKYKNVSLFSADGPQYTYNPDALKGYVSDTRTGISGSAVQSDSDGLTLKVVKVTYSAGGYTSTVTADIKITKPGAMLKPSQLTLSSLPNFALIAKTALTEPTITTDPVTVTGNVYAGSVFVSGNGNKLNIKNAASFVTGGNVTVDASAVLSLSANSALWAKDIILDSSGEIDLSGDAFISDDLNLRGDGAKAVLSGRYFGYGNSTTEAQNSSSIIVNGKHTLLDMNGLSALILAGHSFIDCPGSEIAMGQSVSVKSDQVAYLLSESCLPAGFTNPYQTDADNQTLYSQIILDKPLYSQFNKTLEDYGINETNKEQCIQLIHKQFGDITIVYFCIQFPTPAYANAYFADYFQHNYASIQRYLDLYSRGIFLNNPLTPNLAGGMYTFNTGANTQDASDDTRNLIDATSVPASTIQEISDSYANLCVTLSKDIKGNGEASPYEYFLDTNQITGTATYSKDGAVRAVVTNASEYKVSDALELGPVNLIISSGDILVDEDFTGIIIAKGTVSLLHSVTADSTAAMDALQALLADGGGSYLNPKYFSSEDGSPEELPNGASWNLNKLVTFENWKKNAD